MFPRRYRNVSPVCTTSGRAHSVRVRDDQNLGIILNRRRRDDGVAKARRTSFDHEQHPRQSVMRAGELECFEIGSGSLDSASGPTWHATDVAEPLDVNESDASAISRIRSARWRDIPSRCGGELIRSRETMPVSIPATCTRRSAVSSSSPQSGFAAAFPVDDFALTLAERRLFEALDHHGVRYMLLGMGAALLEGAPVATQDLDVMASVRRSERRIWRSSLSWRQRFWRGSRTKSR